MYFYMEFPTRSSALHFSWLPAKSRILQRQNDELNNWMKKAIDDNNIYRRSRYE